MVKIALILADLLQVTGAKGLQRVCGKGLSKKWGDEIFTEILNIKERVIAN